MSKLQEYRSAAYDRGKDEALKAASWVVDGNTSQDHIRQMVKWWDGGDPQFHDYLPKYPDLSGEFADSLTPHKLANEICGLNNCSSDDLDDLIEGFAEGVADFFEPECVKLLRQALAYVAVIYNPDDSVQDYAYNWETGQNFAANGYKVEALLDDGHMTIDKAQRLYDAEKERYDDCFGARIDS